MIIIVALPFSFFWDMSRLFPSRTCEPLREQSLSREAPVLNGKSYQSFSFTHQQAQWSFCLLFVRRSTPARPQGFRPGQRRCQRAECSLTHICRDNDTFPTLIITVVPSHQVYYQPTGSPNKHLANLVGSVFCIVICVGSAAPNASTRRFSLTRARGACQTPLILQPLRLRIHFMMIYRRTTSPSPSHQAPPDPWPADNPVSAHRSALYRPRWHPHSSAVHPVEYLPATVRYDRKPPVVRTLVAALVNIPVSRRWMLHRASRVWEGVGWAVSTPEKRAGWTWRSAKLGAGRCRNRPRQACGGVGCSFQALGRRLDLRLCMRMEP